MRQLSLMDMKVESERGDSPQDENRSRFFIWGTLDGFLRQQGVERYVFLKQGRAEVSRILTTIFRGLESKQGTREGQEYTEREVKAGAAPIGKP
ncbi:unnamed protein product [Dovyalis caffra]|uniref:Uncharacterized protein n=1 Tax=Dovyalis caffra TaxID=77055 RepID=A0AAV1R6G4_9ROSI|nr:unnamed protein product [Dovyalis caffra]